MYGALLEFAFFLNAQPSEVVSSIRKHFSDQSHRRRKCNDMIDSKQT